ncbi:MAG: decaprenyl-phosphate phosphoribosyltransferase [Alphaproteobacteria bacterium]|nr:decaprenyl-phosphate phosphoribosyltransferase [Alphaproteobacteria bacterium]
MNDARASVVGGVPIAYKVPRMQIPALIRLIRPRQWVKNAFVAAPLFFSPWAVDATSVVRVVIAVAVFSLLSSAVYVINDFCDREADRLHPEKKLRPLASGDVTPMQGAILAAVLLTMAAVGAAVALPRAFLVFAGVYFVLNLLYSVWLKHVAILDVMIVAAGFVLRIDAGASVIDVTPSVWISLATGLLALFLAIAKRRDDLVKTMSSDHRASLAGYNLRFVDTCLAVTLGALLVCYLMYTTDSETIRRFRTENLWLTAPFVIAGVMRYLQITLVEERSGSPTDIVVTDRFLIVTIFGWAATFAWLIYG